jgi:hypothetical protein
MPIALPERGAPGNPSRLRDRRHLLRRTMPGLPFARDGPG